MAMRFGKVGLSVFVCLLAVFSTSLGFRLPIVSESRVLAQTVDGRKAEADRLLRQGIQQFDTSQFTDALQSWEQALTIYREIKDRKGEGAALGSLGLAHDSLGNYPKAIDYYQQSLLILREIRNRRGEGTAQGNLGIVYNNLGDYPKAIDHHQQHLAIALEIKDRQGEGAALSNLGLAYYSLRDYPKAIGYHQQSLSILREIRNRRGEGTVLGNLGIAYRVLGEYSKAIEYLQQSLVIAREIKDRQGEGTALRGLGNAYYFLGDYAKAVDYHQESLAIAREIKDRQGKGVVLRGLGNAYYSLGNYSKAIDYYQQSLATAQEIKDRFGESQSLGNIGNTYYLSGDYSKAINYYQQSLTIAQKIKDRLGESQSLGNLGNAYDASGDYFKAIDYYQQSLAIARETQDRFIKGISLNNLGYTLYKQGKLALAENTLIEGITVYESLRSRELEDSDKVSIFETQRNIYNTLQEVLIAQNKTDAALEISERGRGRAFVELLASRLSANPKEQFPTPPNITEIRQIAKAQNSTLVQYSITYDDFKINGKPQTKESKLYIWVIKPTGEIIFHKTDLKPLWQKENTTLTQLINNTRDSMGVVDISRRHGALKPAETEVNTQGNQTQNLKKLHKLLIQPIAKHLPKNPKEKVIFIPQESLFLAPFPSLQDDKGKYLIEKHTILTAPSIQVLDLTRQQKVAKQKQREISAGESLIVGNPTMPIASLQPGEEKIKLPPLKGAEKEAQIIASLPLLNSKPLIGNAATETAVVAKMFQAKYIHLATHGLFDDIRGLGSAIALAPSNQDDGLLTAEEIFNFQQKFNQKLNADLVVLSACDTGRGRITGDGVIGLSRSFISAGVPSVIVSLWSVDDGSTAFLMTKFYQNLERNPDKAKALREAMLETKKQYSQPLQWAAFTLIGESE
jgi:CHAT domain-containing protein/tetratricopeptide (TPR) repeat protein